MNTILILGGTGKTGRRIVRRLRDAGQPVRTASRTGSDTPFDLNDPSTWASALDGVSAAYLVLPNLRPGPEGEQQPSTRFVTEAVAAGVRRLVLLSAGGSGEPHHGSPLIAAEQAVRDSGVDWTVLRPTWFSQNFSESFFLPGILAGALSLPTGEGRTPFIDAEDIAETAASALTEQRHSGRTYQLTGPRALTFGEVADLIGKATGRTVRHIDVDPEVYLEQQIAQGVPADAARQFAALLAATRDDLDAATADGVERALGRAPRSFEDYVTETAATGCWS
ncbi:SDR family oxidoreductase [Streptacidiphilus sp. N1-12]|uniref:SDR family oxidoreductase n=2 Tax=Streptacidiphilus alkalitolerans TaxID=3342712 RepID=A0ABV6WMV4_9ACTN